MLLEALIAMSVLVVGLGGLLVLMVSSLYADNRSRGDTTATMVAEHILEQISSQQASASTSIPITDCAGTTFNMSTVGAPLGSGNSGSNGGNGAALTSTGTIDWTQSFSNIPTDASGNVYAIQYVACGIGGKQTKYDIRWNVTWMNGYTTASYTQNTVYSQMVAIAARPIASTQVGGLRFSVPANLRTVQGM